MKKRILLAVLATILAAGLAIAAVWFNLGFRQHAVVQPVAKVRVFFDEAQTQELQQGETIEWGEVHSGIQTKSLWINNTGPVDAVLQFNYNGQQLPGGWQNYWDYDGSPLPVGQTIMVTVTLELPADIGAGEYWWDSGISASQAP